VPSVQQVIELRTDAAQALYDITEEVRRVVHASGVRTGLAAVYAQGATSAVMIQENWDDSVQRDVVRLLTELIPAGVWEHDRQDGNGDAHLKAGIVGPSETIPIVDGDLGLSRWQNIFFCEFDGPGRGARPWSPCSTPRRDPRRRRPPDRSGIVCGVEGVGRRRPRTRSRAGLGP
jgi:secondary thiamine-phosphate synthase enzyme